jgi:O-antigen ligase
MSIRVAVLFIFVAALAVYAWKDWFKSLCGLILLMAVIENDNMPKDMLGIQGFNVWNLLMLVVLLAWFMNRRREGLTWDMPRHINILLLLYLGVILVGWVRAAIDRSHIENYPLRGLISEQLINTIKWVIPGLLLFHGCRTRKRLRLALVCLLAMYLLIAVQVIRHMPFAAISHYTEAALRTRGKIDRNVGYNAVDISVFLAGAFWGIIAILPAIRKKIYWLGLLAAAGIVLFAQALTGGRGGYLAWGATGFVLCLLKWRKLLLLAPVVLMLLPVVFPGPTQRMLSGFGERNAEGQKVTNDYEVTSGRTRIWPYVIDKIGESPLIGYGRLGMNRTGLANQLMTQLGESFPHPHNMYLETLLDNGILGSMPILVFWLLMVIYSAQLFRNSDPLCSAVGGLSLALTLAQLFGGVGGQSIYPRESTLGTWVAMFLSLRVYVEQKRVQIATVAPEYYWEAELLPQQPPVAAYPYMYERYQI